MKEYVPRTSLKLCICILKSTFTGLALCSPVRRARAAPPVSAMPLRTRAASAPRGCALGPAGSPDEGDRKRGSDPAELAFQVVQREQERGGAAVRAVR